MREWSTPVEGELPLYESGGVCSIGGRRLSAARRDRAIARLTAASGHVTFWLHMQIDDLDAVFSALAHRDRRRILDLVRENPGCRVEDLRPHFATSRVALLKHLRVLERAQLIVSERVGRERRLHFNVVPIQLIHERWATDFGALWAGQLTRLKYRIEAEGSERSRRRRGG
jgi:DNA-binding transcriptional ArsR family regulator